MPWRPSEEKIRRRYKRLARVSGAMAAEVARLREENDHLRNVVALAVIGALIAGIVAAVAIMGRAN